MKTYKRILNAIIFLLIISLTIMHNIAYANKSLSHVNDKANLLSQTEINQLEDIALKNGEEVNIGIYILTHNDKNAVDAEIYIEDFYDNKVYNIMPDSVILLIDMYNRDVCIEGYGFAEIYIHSFRGDEIRDKISSNLSSGDYYDAISTFINMSNQFMKDDSDLNYDHDYSYSEIDRNNYYNNKYNNKNSIFFNVFFQLFISLVIATIVILSMLTSSSGKVSVNSRSYLDNSKNGLIGRRDSYVTTRITRVKKPDPPSSGSSGHNSSGHRGGVSSGGRSHSTSRGKF